MKLLKWPFGYRSGLTISNDAEYLTHKGWLALENFFHSIFGAHGLFSTSLFLVNPDPEDPAMSLFNSDGTTSSEFNSLSSLILRKSIDGIHAIGNFDNADFCELPIKNIISETAQNFSFDWWSNHGSSNNRQNIGHRDLNNYQQGDLQNSPYRSIDFARNLGVNYLWLDDNLLHRNRVGIYSDLFTPRILRDNTRINTFNRFRGLPGDYAPTLASLRRQVANPVIQNLLLLKQGLVIYQHLGIAQRSGKAISKVVEAESDIPESAMDFFQSLARFRKKGLWVASTSTFLNYTYAIQNLSIRERRGALVISPKENSRLCLDYISIMTKNPIEEVFLEDTLGNVSNFAEFTSMRIKTHKYITVLGGKRDQLL